MINTAVVIPCLNPDDRMVDYVKALSDQGFAKIIVVNDGSTEEYDPFFARAESYSSCVVLRHVENRGKGCALKTAMKYYLDSVTDCNGIITADADGQHTLEDAVNIAGLMNSMDDALILGSRDFSQDDVPARSRFGNRCTSVVFKLAHGSYLRDTQTGLRGIPNKLIPVFADLRGERYEYEMNMLIYAAHKKTAISEVKIETIYIDNNSGSHFNAVRDGLRIYKLLFGQVGKFMGSSLLSALVDYVIFTLLRLLMNGAILIPTFIARAISSVVNYFVNREVVFRAKNCHGSFLKYYILVAIIAFLSSQGIRLLNLIGINPQIGKIIVDALLFVVSYRVQNLLIFKRDEK